MSCSREPVWWNGRNNWSQQYPRGRQHARGGLGEKEPLQIYSGEKRAHGMGVKGLGKINKCKP